MAPWRPCSFEQSVQLVISRDRSYRRSEVLDSFPNNSVKGVYAWWFKNMPAFVPLKGAPRARGMTLLYVGTSERPLRKRLREHVGDDTSRSTLRRSIGCLLSEQLQIEFVVKRQSRGTRCHFGFDALGEIALSNWMEENACVSWVEHSEPLHLEDHLIKSLIIPMNIKGNSHPFAGVLHSRRVALFDKARALPPYEDENS
jgi:hypothetical protein